VISVSHRNKCLPSKLDAATAGDTKPEKKKRELKKKRISTQKARRYSKDCSCKPKIFGLRSIRGEVDAQRGEPKTRERHSSRLGSGGISKRNITATSHRQQVS